MTACHQKRARILLVDDEPVVREELGGILQDEGYEVITGADGEEGLVLFRQQVPDMVITDVRMPRRDGLSLTEAIRTEAPNVPVTVITGHGTETMAIEALRAGVTDFIKKPVRLEDLLSAVARMESARSQARPHEHAGIPEAVQVVELSWVYRLENDPSVIPAFVDMLLDRCAAGVERRKVLELGLALRELILNAMEHGNLGLSFEEKTRALETGTLERLLLERARQPERARRRVLVEARLGSRGLTICITDEGEGFDWRALPDPLEAGESLLLHGRGVLLARMSTDSLHYSEGGTRVTVVKEL